MKLAIRECLAQQCKLLKRLHRRMQVEGWPKQAAAEFTLVMQSVESSLEALSRKPGRATRFTVDQRMSMAHAAGTLPEVAAQYGCHEGTVSAARREFGTTRRGRSKKSALNK